MALNPEIKKVLVLGPVNSLHSSRDKYTAACFEACKALKEQGLHVVLLFANENFQLADNSIADAVYSEPYCLESFEKIVDKEKPDIVLPVCGGKKALSLVEEAGEKGVLSEKQVSSPWIPWENIKNICDHQSFKDTLLKISEPVIPSKMVATAEQAVSYAESAIGYPVLVKPVIENGKAESSIALTRDDLLIIAEEKLKESTSSQIVIEKSISGWKQILFSIMRDRDGITATISSVESLEPVENQNYKSVLICPATSISNLENAMLENGAKKIVNALNLCGECIITFALKPNSKEYVVLDVNPTLNHCATFCSKAVDYPVAKNSVLLSCGYTIPELNVQNENGSYSIPVQKQIALELNLAASVMSIGSTFEEALMKACQSKVCNNLGLRNKNLEFESSEEIRNRVATPSVDRIFAVYEAIRRNILTHEEIYRSVRIDWCYLDKLQNIADLERKLDDVRKGISLLTFDLYESAKIMGFSDEQIQAITGISVPGANGVISMVDAVKDMASNRKLAHLFCGYNFISKRKGAKSQIFHSVYQGETVSLFESNENQNAQKRILIVCGNADSYEYDANVIKAIKYFKSKGFFVSVINNCPFTVSSSPILADRVYLESVTAENIMNIVVNEKPESVCLYFAGESALELGGFLEQQGIRLLGYNIAGKKIGDNLSNLPQNAEPDIFVEVDVLTDAKSILIPAIIEKKKLLKNSDAFISVYPLWTLSDVIRDRIIKQAYSIAQKINIKGLLNIEFGIVNNVSYIKCIKTWASKQLSFVEGVTQLPVIELCCELMNGKDLLSLGYGSGVFRLPSVHSVKLDYAGKNNDVKNSSYTSFAPTRKEALYKALSGAEYSLFENKSVTFAIEGHEIFQLPSLAKQFSSLGFKLYGTKENVKLLSGFGINCEMVEEASEKKPVLHWDVLKEAINFIKADCNLGNMEPVNIKNIMQAGQTINFAKMASNGSDFIIINGDDFFCLNYSSLAIDLCKRNSSIGSQFLIVITRLSESVPFVRIFSANGKELLNQTEALGVAARYCYEKNRKTEGVNLQLETGTGIHNLILYKKNNVITSVCEKVNIVSPDCENKQIFAGGMNYGASFVKLNNTHCIINTNCVEKIDLELFGNMMEDDMMEDDMKGVTLQFISISSDNSMRIRTWNSTDGEMVSSVEGACGAVIAGVMNGWCKKDQDIFVTFKGGQLCVRYTNDTLYVTSGVQNVYQGQIQL